nr:MAG TPA: Mastoparan peptide [Caudoviricetes sp.]
MYSIDLLSLGKMVSFLICNFRKKSIFFGYKKREII